MDEMTKFADNLGAIIGKLIKTLVMNGVISVAQMADIMGMSIEELKEHAERIKAAAADPKGSEENDATN